MNNNPNQTYQLNPNFIPVFLEGIPNRDSKIFLAILLCFMLDQEFSIDGESIAELLNMPDEYIHQAINFYKEKGVFLTVSNSDINTEETLPY